jgi:tight adherence protein B
VNPTWRAFIAPAAVLVFRELVVTAPPLRTLPNEAKQTRRRQRVWWRLPQPFLEGRSRVREMAIAVLVTAIVWTMASPVLGLAAGVGATVLRRSLHRWRQQRVGASFDRDLLPFVEEIGRNLRSGSTVIESLKRSAESFGSHASLAALAKSAGTSNGVVEALTQWKSLAPTVSAEHVRQLLLVGETIGGLRPQFVDGIASSLRESNQLRGEIRVLSDQAKYSAILMSIAPLLFAAGLVATDTRAKSFLLQTSIGGIVVLVGLALDLAGLLWMRRLVIRVSGVAK